LVVNPSFARSRCGAVTCSVNRSAAATPFHPSQPSAPSRACRTATQGWPFSLPRRSRSCWLSCRVRAVSETRTGEGALRAPHRIRL